VYFSGHADAVDLHLGGALLSWRELLELTNAAQATTRVVVVDACRSGEATLQKGARRGAPFALTPEDAGPPTGLAILASASAGESAQESPKLRGSFFTFHLISALRGAADFNGDGRVSLTEAFQYSADETASSTASTLVGVQHATYRYQLRGRADLVLTQPSAGKEDLLVTLAGPGEYIFHAGGPAGPIALQTHAPAAKTNVGLPAGEYYVRRRTPRQLLGGPLTLRAGAPALVSERMLSPIDYEQVASKGGPAEPPIDATVAAWTVSAWMGTGTPQLPSFGMPWEAGVGTSRRVGPWVVDGVVRLSVDHAQNAALSIQMLQGAMLPGVRWLLVDDPAWQLSTGVRAGAVFGRQSFSDAAVTTKTQVTAYGEAIARADIQIAAGAFLGIEVGGGAGGPRTAQHAVTWQARGALGLGYAW
jgi:hypothetical protein